MSANGVLTAATFDAANRVLSLTATKGGQTVYSQAFGYDLAGSRRTSTQTIVGIGTRQLTWSYDGLYRLTGESWTGLDAQSRTYGSVG